MEVFYVKKGVYADIGVLLVFISTNSYLNIKMPII